MERCTIRLKTGEARCTQLDGNVVVERLAAYEDTEWEPEQIEALGGLFDFVAEESKSMTEQFAMVDRLRELAVADKEGRVIVLPCKVGEPAYWVHNGIITDCRINRIQANRKGVFLCLKSTKAHGAFRVDVCLGKTVFLTREDAEKALEELEGNT